jgi:hypothetical protein
MLHVFYKNPAFKRDTVPAEMKEEEARFLTSMTSEMSEMMKGLSLEEEGAANQASQRGSPELSSRPRAGSPH